MFTDGHVSVPGPRCGGLPGLGPKQRQPAEEEIPLHPEETTAHQQAGSEALHPQAKQPILLTPPANTLVLKKRHFTFCEYVPVLNVITSAMVFHFLIRFGLCTFSMKTLQCVLRWTWSFSRSHNRLCT